MFKKINIHKRILLMFTAIVLLSAVSLGIILFVGMADVRRNTQKIGEEFGNSVTNFADEIISYHLQRQIREVTLYKVRQVERELASIKDHTAYLANAMTSILQHPERYSKRELPTPFERQIKSGEGYLLIATKLQAECDRPDVWESIHLAANIVDYQESMAKFYENSPIAFNFGSKYGYFISLENYKTEEKYRDIHSDSYHSSYDPRQRSWYKRAQKAMDVGFTDVYPAVNGAPRINCSAPFYDKEGFAGVMGFGVQLESLYNLVTENSLGESGINFALNKKGELLFSSQEEGLLSVGDGHKKLKDVPEPSIAKEALQMINGESGFCVVTIDGEEYYFSYAPITSMGWSFGALLKCSEALAPTIAVKDSLISQTKKFNAVMNSIFVGNVISLTVLFAALIWLFFIVSRMTAEKFGKPIFTLIDGVREIAQGNLDKKIEIKTGNEIEELSNSVNHMTARLKDYMDNLVSVTAEKQKVETELSMAQDIQKDMIPHIFPAYPDRNEIDLYASNKPAKEMGGDFYDFYMPDDNRLVVTMADVSGKGIGAALFMVTSKAILKNTVLASNENNLADCLSRANNQIQQNNEAMMFVTIFLGELNMKTVEFSFVNGGHNPPLVYRAKEKKFEYLSVEKNTVVGARKNYKFKGQSIKISPGDLLFLYTDGVTEAINEKNELYGEERLLNVLNGLEEVPSSKELIRKVQESLNAYMGKAEQFDDITMLSLKYLGENGVKKLQ